jgi:hypothetical protein
MVPSEPTITVVVYAAVENKEKWDYISEAGSQLLTPFDAKFMQLVDMFLEAPKGNMTTSQKVKHSPA